MFQMCGINFFCKKYVFNKYSHYSTYLMFLLDLLVTTTSYNIVAQALSGILYHTCTYIYKLIVNMYIAFVIMHISNPI